MINIRILFHDHIFEINVPRDIPIFELKERIYEERGIYHDSPLIYKGRVLKDGKTIEYYNIRNNDIIQLMERYVGGGPEIENKELQILMLLIKEGILVMNIIIR